MIRVGIIGLGFIGLTAWPEIDETTGADVVALADIDQASLRKAGEVFEVPVASQYGSALELIENEAVDAVLIATPHTLHFEQVSAALARDLHVLCEKPLTTDFAQARELVEREAASEGSLTVGYDRRLDPAFVNARAYVADHLGGVNFVTAKITQHWITEQRGKWRTNPDLSGGGQLYDTGSHLVDVVLWMTETTPARVSAEMVFADEDERVDIQAGLTVLCEDGALLCLAVSGDTPETREHIHLWGDEGAVYVTGEAWGPRAVETLGLSDPEPVVDPNSRASKGAAFIEGIRGDRDPFATAQEALVVTALTEAAYESARNGRRVDIDL